jgi:hypothetical protein
VRFSVEIKALIGRFSKRCVKHFAKRRNDSPLVAFEIAMDGEWPYVRPLVLAASKWSDVDVLLVQGRDCKLAHPELLAEIEDLPKSVRIVSSCDAENALRCCTNSIFVTSEQFGKPLSRPSVCIFHGQPSKGLTFTREILSDFDHFFLLGPLQRRCLEEFVARSLECLFVPSLHEIGYPKSDKIVVDAVDPEFIRRQYSIPDGAKIVLYAPAFNEGCTLRTIGLRLIETLASLNNVFVIVKLAPDMVSGLSSDYFAGGCDWGKLINEMSLSNVAVAAPLDISPCLAAADIMVTDVSGVAYEMLCIGKPVVFYECPSFYSNYVMNRVSGLSLRELIENDTMNGGRNYGTVVRTLEELCWAVQQPSPSVDRRYMTEMLLFNAGNAADSASACIRRLLGLSL